MIELCVHVIICVDCVCWIHMVLKCCSLVVFILKKTTSLKFTIVVVVITNLSVI